MGEGTMRIKGTAWRPINQAAEEKIKTAHPDLAKEPCFDILLISFYGIAEREFPNTEISIEEIAEVLKEKNRHDQDALEDIHSTMELIKLFLPD